MLTLFYDTTIEMVKTEVKMYLQYTRNLFQLVFFSSCKDHYIYNQICVMYRCGKCAYIPNFLKQFIVIIIMKNIFKFIVVGFSSVLWVIIKQHLNSRGQQTCSSSHN